MEGVEVRRSLRTEQMAWERKGEHDIVGSWGLIPISR